MALWANKSTGILFGGVTDDDTSEETLESLFWNDLLVHLTRRPATICSNISSSRCLFSASYRNGYQLTGNGRWVSMTLKRPKKNGAQKRKKGAAAPFQTSNKKDYDSDSEGEAMVPDTDNTPDPEIDPDDPYLTIPLTRYNAMLAVLRNTLYMYEKINQDLRSSADTRSSIDMAASTNEARESTL
jgi:hypothetical protein